jgi:thiol-disulfide isomerase/thioredoxin
MKIRAAAAAIALVVPLASAADPPGAGAPAPDIELPRAQEPPLRLGSLKGQVVLVDFWASWCGPCASSFPALDALYKRRHGDGLEVLAVNVDEDRRAADAFLKGRAHEMPVFFDLKGQVPAAFKVEGMPSSYLLDRRGRIRFKHVGYTAAIASAQEHEIEALLAEKEQP